VVRGGAVVDGTSNRAACLSTACNNFIGVAAGSTGNLQISGPGSRVDLINNLSVGKTSLFTLEEDGFDYGIPGGTTQGSVRIFDGGILNVEQAIVGWAPAGPSSPDGAERGNGSIVVLGAGSQFNIVGDAIGLSQLELGRGANGSGTLGIGSGGSVLIDSNVVGQSARFVFGSTGSASVLIDGPGSSLRVENASLTPSLSVIANARVEVQNGGLLQLTDENLLIRGAAGQIAALSITGSTSRVDVGSGIVSVGGIPGHFGVVDLADGATITAGNIVLGRSSALRGTGVVDGNVIMAGGSVLPGNSPGRIDILGDFTMTEGLLDLEFAGLTAGLYDQINILGNVNVTGGTIRFTYIDGFLPTFGDTFDFLTFSDPDAIFQNLSFEFLGVPTDFLYSIDQVGLDGNRGAFRFISRTTVPEPGTLALLTVGLLAAGLSRRRVSVKA
jgi:T5SS/PEP-CTERM-associated repeat protein